MEVREYIEDAYLEVSNTIKCHAREETTQTSPHDGLCHECFFLYYVTICCNRSIIFDFVDYLEKVFGVTKKIKL